MVERQLADLAVLGSDPLADVSQTRAIERIFGRGCMCSAIALFFVTTVLAFVQRVVTGY